MSSYVMFQNNTLKLVSTLLQKSVETWQLVGQIFRFLRKQKDKNCPANCHL